jgi:hypothetical protein
VLVEAALECEDVEDETECSNDACCPLIWVEAGTCPFDDEGKGNCDVDDGG